ncbi:hypothetical protein DSLASN_13010 [Desulfoluna limicola]|uniref:Uncharacterized protein n=1 Tax=Desulfoluna limicola TaxID=2810562 RepID=A0ABN6F116_9BACT|nr:hypothetical protein [Desulfoluna limicola]BCS95669.1 hypothetical protein DSLASN_13010 [Desulfoluna limicola]
MEINQKRFFNWSRFTFDDERLTCTMGHEDGSCSFGVNYADIPMEQTSVEQRIPWFRNAGLVLLIIWLCRTLVGLVEPASAPGLSLYWPLAATCCFLIYRVAVTRFTVLKTDAGELYLICDTRHDEVLDELMTRRKSQLLSWYGEIDYANDPGEEIRKFHWLKMQGVIGDDEFETIRTRIEVFHGPMQDTDFMEGPSIN